MLHFNGVEIRRANNKPEQIDPLRARRELDALHRAAMLEKIARKHVVTVEVAESMAKSLVQI